MGSGCKPDGLAYGGSNPSRPTTHGQGSRLAPRCGRRQPRRRDGALLQSTRSRGATQTAPNRDDHRPHAPSLPRRRRPSVRRARSRRARAARGPSFGRGREPADRAPSRGGGSCGGPRSSASSRSSRSPSGSSFSNSPFKLEIPGHVVLRRADPHGPAVRAGQLRDDAARHHARLRRARPAHPRLDPPRRRRAAPPGRADRPLGWLLAALDPPHARDRAHLQPRRLQLRRAGRDGHAAPEPLPVRAAARSARGPSPTPSTRSGRNVARPLRAALPLARRLDRPALRRTTSWARSCGLRLLEVAAVAILASRCPVLARGLGYDPGHAFVLCLLNPLVVLTVVGGAHNDGLMVALLVAGLALAVKRHPVWGIVVCALAASIKAPAALGIVYIAWEWLGPEPAAAPSAAPARDRRAPHRRGPRRVHALSRASASAG